MMRDRFRFRAWDTHNNKYIYDAEMTYDDIGVRAECFGYMVDDYYNYEYIVEQCTGLKDTNGKLIYEGDIVKVIYNEELNTLSKQIYPMLFNDKVAKFGFKHPDGHFFYFTNDEDYSYEVIGNIHENPELLEEYKKMHTHII
jgi:uncharacterized phage protein (TIGR01671 family)